jgi:rubrerythrin
MKGGDYSMGYDFNADEVFEIAEQIEKNGANFYREMAEKFPDVAIRQLFLELASMEDKHEKLFISMRKDLSDKEREPTVFDPENESVQYLMALADLRVFDEKAKEDFILPEELTEKEKMKRTLQEAINREKESIVFYLGMKELLPVRLGKDKIDDIIKEEMGHTRLLSNRLMSLPK